MPKKQRERRRRGDGSVTVARRDASGKPILWKACVSLGVITINGKPRRHRPTEYAETEAEAHRLLKQLQAQHLTGDDMTPSTQTVEAFLLRWLAHVKTVRSLGTYEVYEARCRCHIIPAIGGLKLRALKTAHVQTMLDALARKGLAPNTISGIRSTIIKALNMARKWGDLKRDTINVAADTEIEPVIEQKPPTLDEAQLDRLLATAAGDDLEPLIVVALGTGYRIGECLGLLWANIDEDHEEIHLTGALKRRKAEQPRPGAHYNLIRE
ncbi:MAG TPA: site-specific integrase, partial [Roseiflexaceae bacterium]|nr:site-specific integrase [Roseiflexaceae bacterium]